MKVERVGTQFRVVVRAASQRLVFWGDTEEEAIRAARVGRAENRDLAAAARRAATKVGGPAAAALVAFAEEIES